MAGGVAGRAAVCPRSLRYDLAGQGVLGGGGRALRGCYLRAVQSASQLRPLVEAGGLSR